MKKNNPLLGSFEEAVVYVNSYTDPIPADLLLKLYAYYKIANQNFEHPGSKSELINAFKANALIQAQKIKPKKAMKLYIELVDNQLKNISD
ncbi:MAG: acyl-CoA-binding protein [Bacteroidia bacterium]|nr:acyl-CoA-binding protein [Bacteroidia bacterium]